MEGQDIQPPQLLLKFFRWFCNPAFAEDIEGDLTEIFERSVKTHGEKRARWLFTFQILKLFRPGIIKTFIRINIQSTRYGMFKNYLFTAFRNMKREKLFAIMNITGLAIGIGCGLVIYKIVTYELSFDSYHPNAENTYRLITEFNHPQYGTGLSEGQVHPLGEAMRTELNVPNTVMTFYAGEGQVTVADANGNPDRFAEYKGIGYVEENFFQLFHYDFIIGDPAKALTNTGSAVITSSLAQKYFKLKPDDVASAVGKSLTINNARTFLVTAVVKDIPENTDVPFTLIANYKDQSASSPYYTPDDWNNYNSDVNCYFMVDNATQAASLQRLLPAFFEKYCGKERASFAKYVMQPLSRLHFDTANNYSKRTVSYSRLTILGVVGIFLVLSACINFINMATAQAVKRAKEIGVRKSLGVKKSQLTIQFLSETVFISVLASVAGLIIAQFLFISLENILGYHLDVGIFTNASELLFVIALAIGVGLLSGFYPAMVMAGMNPIKALKNSLHAKSASGLLSMRRTLVIIQFVISQVLIIGTIVATQQMDLFLGNDIGFEKEAVLITQNPGGSADKLQSFKNAISSKAGIEMVSVSVAGPMAQFRVVNNVTHPKVRPEDLVSGNLKTADENYIELFHLKLIAGKNLPIEKDTKDAVVNRKLTKTLGYENPEEALGDTFGYSDDLEFRIVGVVEDFHSVSFHFPAENVILSNLPWNMQTIAIKLDASRKNFSDMQATINDIKTEWDKLYPETIFDYTFLDEQIAMMYHNEQKTSQLFQIFSIVAIFIGCLGLYGLVSYMANQKVKEIGIRKVLGASMPNIIGIFSKELLILVVVAFVVSVPLAWYVMNNWLQAFEYRVALSPIFFGAALLVSVLIAFMTTGYKAIVASSANPVDSLKSE